MSVKSSSAAGVFGEREVVITRIFDAPRELVFKAWTNPKHMIHWWGYSVLQTPFAKWMLQPGGNWQHCKCADQAASTTCRALSQNREPERLVFTNNAEDTAGNLLLEGLTTVTFEDYGGKTKLTLQTRAIKVGSRCARHACGDGNGLDTELERLDAHVAGPWDRGLVFTRLFDAREALV